MGKIVIELSDETIEKLKRPYHIYTDIQDLAPPLYYAVMDAIKNLKNVESENTIGNNTNGEEKLKEKIIKLLDELKSVNPNQQIYVETPNGMASCKLGDALIFESMDGQIAIDSE